jgi:hypothetical protein
LDTEDKKANPLSLVIGVLLLVVLMSRFVGMVFGKPSPMKEAVPPPVPPHPVVKPPPAPVNPPHSKPTKPMNVPAPPHANLANLKKRLEAERAKLVQLLTEQKKLENDLATWQRQQPSPEADQHIKATNAQLADLKQKIQQQQEQVDKARQARDKAEIGSASIVSPLKRDDATPMSIRYGIQSMSIRFWA